MSNKYTQFQLRAFQKFGIIPVFTEGKPLFTELNKRVNNETLNAWCLRVIQVPFHAVKFYSLTKCSSRIKVENLARRNLQAQRFFNDQVRNLQANIIKKMKVRSDHFVQPSAQELGSIDDIQTMRDAMLFLPSTMNEFIERFVRWQDKGIEWPYALESFFERYVELATIAVNSDVLEDDLDEDDWDDEFEEDDELEFESSFTIFNDDDDDDEDTKTALLEITAEDQNNACELANTLNEKPEVLTITNDFRFTEHSNYDHFTEEYGFVARYMILLDDLEEYATTVSEAINNFSFVDFSGASIEFDELFRVIDEIKNENGYPPASDIVDPETDRTVDEKEQVEYMQTCVSELIETIRAVFQEVNNAMEEFWEEVYFQYEDEEDSQDEEYLKAKKVVEQMMNQISDACDTSEYFMTTIAGYLYEGSY